ncbi:orotidine-5'-phosphate decarboxylase [Finegoldia magna]|uniref:Orotidine 5'-phosphate decarboxylase n=2 Tax=Finegoldia magna TaxID=1260 RepID=A0A233W1E3_FINMA|nr:orotidine-5'-phosphate decarboxylase [Finegoldia magna]EFK93662.1 orotidine 5'-phosphate decarboxylase [Finegoldia magna ACS-171-V-Col3]EFL54829.1 orotidine 5'-phosphate decarboxylase [Finegoldia magna BVS033A4]EXF26936.1 orotidine 5'-phosphate decarboxylase [Finegoldia magna ALB8]MDU4732286.1 orotidine-5'-phosphate decarboxylase [Finegoldia magna]MDU5272722.1 orotidine-5'-phosphate decarboxylase [Finegoldia magna]
MIIDKLSKRIDERSIVCVGLDTSTDYVPEKIKKGKKVSEYLFEFNKEIIDNTKDLVACFKVQIAYYEAHGIEGLIAYKNTLKYLKDNDLISIADVKRGDIANTAKEYAKAHFEGDFEADFITVNPFMGYDTLEHYLPYLESKEKGIFVLMRTSNPGSKDIQYKDYKGQPLYYEIGDNLNKIAKDYLGECNLSSLGFVVGGTQSENANKIRERYPNIMFLIPGYGAQGAKPEDIRVYLDNFKKGIVNSSRGIILNYRKFDDGEENIGKYARQAVEDMRKDIYCE